MVKERMGMRFPKLRSESDQLLRLDSLRFIAAVMGVIYLFRNQWLFASGPGWKMARFDSMSLAAALFFFVSGLVITFVYDRRLDYGVLLTWLFSWLAPLDRKRD